MREREALKLALEALEEPKEHIAKHRRFEAINAIKEALTQPEQESDDLTAAYMSGVYDGKNKDAPRREWVGLAAEDRLTAKYMQGAPDGIEAVIDYIEAKLREKNT